MRPLAGMTNMMRCPPSRPPPAAHPNPLPLIEFHLQHDKIPHRD